MSETFTAPVVAKRLGIGVTTLKTWSEKVGIGTKTSSGVWVYTEKDVELLEVVRSFRGDDRGFDTITRRIRAESTDSARRPTDDDGRQPAMSPEQIKTVVIEAIASQTDLSEKYARAAHQIGKLEADNEHLRTQLSDARQRLTTADADAAENERLRAQLAERDAELAKLKEKRPWWRRSLF